jgi:hypothetical protein
MRRLSARQAVTCETAAGPRCKCRCGGLLHGQARIGDAEGAAGLPEDDPHHARPPRPRRAPPAYVQDPLPGEPGWHPGYAP